MSAPETGSTLQLPEHLDAVAVARLYREWSPRAATLARIDFGQVRTLDSTAVALVHALGAEAVRLGGTAPPLVGVPAHYGQLCLAHRIDGGRN